MFIFVKMSHIAEQNNNIVTTFSINEPDNKYVDINTITLYNYFNNCVDYNSNYFAYLTKRRINKYEPSYIFNNVNNTNTEITLLNIVRIPVKEYDKQGLIDALNTMYVNSMLCLHKDIYISEASVLFTIDKDRNEYLKWYRYKYDNSIVPEFNLFNCYNSSNIDEMNKTIDVSKVNNVIKYLMNGTNIILSNNRELRLTNGDKTIYYNNNVSLDDSYEIHVKLLSRFETEEEQLNNMVGEARTYYTFYLTNTNNKYPNVIKWYKVINTTETEIKTSPPYLEINTKFSLSDQESQFQQIICRNDLGELLASLTFRIRVPLSSGDIISVDKNNNTITETKPLNIQINNIFYFQTGSNVSSHFKNITVIDTPDNINIEQLGINCFRVTTMLETIEQTQRIVFKIFGYYNFDTVTTSIYIIKQQPIGLLTNSLINNTIQQEETTYDNNIINYYIATTINNTITTRYSAFDEDIETNFFNKLKNGVVGFVSLDLPNYIYMSGVNGENENEFFILKINLETFDYKIYSTTFPIKYGEYSFISSNNNYGILMLNNTFDELVRQNIKLITHYNVGDNYDINKISFRENLLPINIMSNQQTDINKHPYYGYQTYVQNNLFNIDNNNIYMNKNVHYYNKYCYYSSFNYVKHNAMNYLNKVEQTIRFDDAFVYEQPIIYGNYFMQYILKNDMSCSLSSRYNIITYQPFINNMFIKVMFTYLDDVDNIVNNNHDIGTTYFNTLATFEINDVNKSVYNLNVSKRVNISHGKINIYIISNKLKWCNSGNNNELTYSI